MNSDRSLGLWGDWGQRTEITRTHCGTPPSRTSGLPGKSDLIQLLTNQGLMTPKTCVLLGWGLGIHWEADLPCSGFEEGGELQAGALPDSLSKAQACLLSLGIPPPSA